MPQRSSGTIWLVFGLFFGLIALAVLAFGVFSILHTHGNVRMFEMAVDREAAELERLRPVVHLPQNQAKAQETMRFLEVGLENLREAKSYRNFAIMIAAASLVPGGLALVSMVVYCVMRFKRSRNEPTAKTNLDA